MLFHASLFVMQRRSRYLALRNAMMKPLFRFRVLECSLDFSGSWNAPLTFADVKVRLLTVRSVSANLGLRHFAGPSVEDKLG